MKISVSYFGALPFDNCLEILLPKGSVFYICSRTTNLSAISDFGVGSGAVEMSGITSGGTVEVSVERHWHV